MALYLGNRDLGRTSEVGHNQVVKRIFGQGFTDDLQVLQDNPTRMGVRVSGLAGLISGVNGAFYEAYQVGTDELNIANAPANSNRIDTVVAYADLDTPPRNNVNDNPNLIVLLVVRGTTAVNPSAPNNAVISVATSDNPFIRLADIRVDSGTQAIVNNLITKYPASLVLRTDWDQSDPDTADYIHNKPKTISDAQINKLDGISSQATRNVSALDLVRTDVYRRTSTINITGNNTTGVLISQAWNRPAGWSTYDLVIQASIAFNWLTTDYDTNHQNIGAYIRDDGSTSPNNARDGFTAALQTYRLSAPTLDFGGHVTFNLSYKRSSINSNSLNFRLFGTRTNLAHHVNIHNGRINLVAYRRT